MIAVSYRIVYERCQVTAGSNGKGTSSSWYTSRETLYSVVGRCLRPHKKGAKAMGLGKL